ncbi:MAG: hypothetical protein J0H79_14200 [Alphaproteobacteria bacterium]|nr:hypothetical protein [Alphaproteobacteria bacterium]OJU57339.1 MAG: hypothetical protein BGO00_04580 [Alphaproteobacteria bacterium 62-8]
MVAYSFKRQFVQPIRALNKRQTMRNERKRHARPGEILQLYTGMRTKHCRLIGTATCTAVLPVRLDFVKARVEIGPKLRTDRLDEFAREDGFDTWPDLCAFWAREHSAIAQWSGVLICWTDFIPAGPA